MRDTVTVTYGEENYSPVRYNGFRLGPFQYTTQVRDGETMGEAMKRAHKELEDTADKLFISKRNKFVERMGVLNT